METDREVLIWLHERLVHVHGEKELLDYMHRLRHIIKATPKNQVSTKGIHNDIGDLLRDIEKEL